MCRLGAVGSKPQYTVIGPAFIAARSASRSVLCAMSPRQARSSRRCVTTRILARDRHGANAWSAPAAGFGARRSPPAADVRPVRRDSWLAADPEPPRNIGGRGDPNPRTAADHLLRDRIPEFERKAAARSAGIHPVVRLVDAEGDRETRRTAGEVTVRDAGTP